VKDHLDHNNPPELNQRKSGRATTERSKSQGFSSRTGYSEDARSVFSPCTGCDSTDLQKRNRMPSKLIWRAHRWPMNQPSRSVTTEWSAPWH